MPVAESEITPNPCVTAPLPGSFAVEAEDGLAFAKLQQQRDLVAQHYSETWRTKWRLWQRFSRIGWHLSEGVVMAFLTGAAFTQYRAYQRPIIQGWHGRFCRALGVSVERSGVPFEGNAMWVSNHVSWLDIPVLGSQFPVYFLSKAEVANWPVVGWLAKVAGTLFIKRGSGDADRVMSDLAGHLQAGRHVLFFPEGTTTEGLRLKRFFHKLFAAAVQADVPVQPVVVCYRDAKGGMHPAVPFVGDDEFLTHVTRLLKSEPITVFIRVLPAIPIEGRDARELAKVVQSAMQRALGDLLANDH